MKYIVFFLTACAVTIWIAGSQYGKEQPPAIPPVIAEAEQPDAPTTAAAQQAAPAEWADTSTAWSASVEPIDNFPPNTREAPRVETSPVPVSPPISGGLAPAEAASMVAARRGATTIVVIYKATCPLSRALIQAMNSPGGMSALPGVLAFSIDGRGLPAPFSTYPIRSYAPGELDQAMATVGLQVGSTFMSPLVAVLDREGRLAAEWQGLATLDPLRQAVAGL